MERKKPSRRKFLASGAVVAGAAAGALKPASAETPAPAAAAAGAAAGKKPEEIRAWDIAISPDGHELPPGHGTAKEGRDLFIEKGCSQCHGRNGEGGRAPTLIVMKGMSTMPGRMPGMDMGIQPPGLMAVSAPFATTMWDYINRGMPLGREGSLKPDEVYALTAFLLFRNDVIKSEDDVLDAQTLPKLKMPNLSGYTEHPDWKHATPRLRDYP